jgi:hypothetical protein
MGVRTAVITALAAVVFIPLVTGAIPPPPRMFSPWYADSLRDILDLTQTDVDRIEQQLAADPDDFPARLKVMAYYQRADRSVRREDVAKRAQHTLWLIQHHPDCELLHSPVSRFSHHELTPAAYRHAVALWNSAANAQPRNAAVQWNAASFFQDLDPALYLHYLEATAAADPNHPFALRPLADLYALSILERDPLASRARAGLEASHNVWVLGNAAYMLRSQYNRSVQTGSPNPRAAQLAQRYFLRAKALDPNLNATAILPQLDPQASARAQAAELAHANQWQARANAALGKIRRLPVEAFPNLPPVVSAVLRTRNCRVPQPSLDGAPRNVIRGDFFAKGEAGWAVFCSVDNSTTLLAFRNDRDSSPDTLATSEDRVYLQGLPDGKIGYSREIMAVDRDFIMRHYRAYGGPEPPPIDHQGIDDAFLEKASITWYIYRGKWLKLTGSD